MLEILTLYQGWLGTCVGVIGIAVAILLYRASRTRARPTYQMGTLPLIGSEDQALPEEVEVTFRGTRVKQLSKTLLVFWNSGNVLIDKDHILREDPLRCEFSADSAALRVRLLKTTREVNGFKAIIDPERRNRVLLGFSYLDPGDGGVVEVLHTDKERYPAIRGTVKGVPHGPQYWGRIDPNPAVMMLIGGGIRGRLSIYMALIGGLLATLLAVAAPIEALNPSILRVAVGVSGILYVAGASWFLWRYRRRFPKALAEWQE